MKFLPLAAMACALALWSPAPGKAEMIAATDPRLSQPATHENLTVFFVRGERTASKSTPLTLQQAMDMNIVHVRETGTVNSLQIENLGDRDVFIQAGDIVKGGKQDRVLSVSMILGPKSGPLPIDSFCVEQGRWQKRGNERADTFASSTTSLPSREMKLAAAKPLRSEPGRGTVPPQQEVWASVRKTQDKLAQNIGAPATAAASPSSLQLTMEGEKLESAAADYEKTLRERLDATPDAVGLIVAINGTFSSADLYSSPELFRAMSAKLLRATSIEAVAEKNATAFPSVTADQAVAFLGQANKAAANRRKVTSRVTLETRESDAILSSETQLTEGGWVHRSYLAK